MISKYDKIIFIFLIQTRRKSTRVECAGVCTSVAECKGMQWNEPPHQCNLYHDVQSVCTICAGSDMSEVNEIYGEAVIAQLYVRTSIDIPPCK